MDMIYAISRYNTCVMISLCRCIGLLVISTVKEAHV